VLKQGILHRACTGAGRSADNHDGRYALRHGEPTIRTRPTVSLTIPACNAAATLGPCLRALARQTVRPDELIVVDDGSTDATADVARRAGATLVQHPRNRGVAAARNTAIRAARGALVASLDADLVAPRDWLARLLANFHGRRRITGCCGQVREKHTRTVADRWRAVHMKLSFGQRRSYDPRWLYCGISLIRREAMLEAGLFDERCLTAYEDVDLSRRLRDAGHTLLYDPAVIATHLKQSWPGNVVRGFWSYWAGKNEMEGAYASLTAARHLLVRRQMGIAAYRLALDVRQRRDELLALDLLIPLAFCVRDLEKMVQLKALGRAAQQTLSCSVLEACLDGCARHLGKALPPTWAACAFAGGTLPTARRAPTPASADAYVRTFVREFEGLLTALTPTARTRLLAHLPAVLAEAGS
jgi:GT2 family glycosyltransferase